MTPALELFALQQLDDAIAAARASLADTEHRLQGDPALTAARERLAAATSARDTLQRDQRRLDAETADLTARIEREEARLYGGTIKNPKELGALQHEVETFKAARGELDTRSLELLEALDAANAEFAAAQRDVASHEAQWAAQSRALQQEAVRLQARIAAESGNRQAQAARIPPRFLQLYELVRGRRGSGVARIAGSSCAGCRVAIPDAVRRRAMSATDVAQCPNCERILVPG